MKLRPIIPCLWYDTQAKDAADLYVSLFPNSEITRINYYPDEGKDIHGKDAGTVLMVAFTLDGNKFTAMNGGPDFKFNESISFQVLCDNQQEIDHYWNNLTANGGRDSACGWLKDRFGLSWQIVPSNMGELMSDPARAKRVMHAFMQMKKLDMNVLENA